MSGARQFHDRYQEAWAVQCFANALVDRYGESGPTGPMRPKTAEEWAYELAMFQAIAEDPHALLASGYSFRYRFHDWERDTRGKLVRCKATAEHVWMAAHGGRKEKVV